MNEISSACSPFEKELTHPVHVIDLSHVVALKNWQEGYEELGAIPYSFAVELQDDAPCLFFADSAEDKVSHFNPYDI